MKNCYNKVVHTCDGMRPLTCTEYEGTVNSESSLVGENCLNGEEVIQDIYDQLDSLDLSELGKKCLTYVKEDDKNVVKNILLKFEEEICSLKAKLAEAEEESNSICSQSIADCDLDLSCLELPCDKQINTYKELFQALIDKVCEQ
jgi:hypothetical protein